MSNKTTILNVDNNIIIVQKDFCNVCLQLSNGNLDIYVIDINSNKLLCNDFIQRIDDGSFSLMIGELALLNRRRGSYTVSDDVLLREIKQCCLKYDNNGKHVKTSMGIDIKQYDSAQLLEIKRGLEDYLDTRLYENPKFNFRQMMIIRLGLLAGVNVNYYASPNYTWQQMNEIYLGLLTNVDVSQYCNEFLKYEDMRDIRMKYDKLFKDSYAYCKRQYILQRATNDRVEQLFLGFAKGIDLSKYFEDRYDSKQLEQIRIGILNGLDISYYLSIDYNHMQMEAIRLGLENGVDVSLYCNTTKSYAEMGEIYLELVHGKNKNFSSLNSSRKSVITVNYKDHSCVMVNVNNCEVTCCIGIGKLYIDILQNKGESKSQCLNIETESRTEIESIIRQFIGRVSLLELNDFNTYENLLGLLNSYKDNSSDEEQCKQVSDNASNLARQAALDFLNGLKL